MGLTLLLIRVMKSLQIKKHKRYICIEIRRYSKKYYGYVYLLGSKAFSTQDTSTLSFFSI